MDTENATQITNYLRKSFRPYWRLPNWVTTVRRPSMGEHRATQVIEFECHHTRVFQQPAPKVGDILWCPKCNRDVGVIRGVSEWRIRCQNCIYSRPFGSAKLNAEISAAKHRMRNPAHVVRIYNGSKFVRQFPDKIKDGYQTVIPMSSNGDQQAPF